MISGITILDTNVVSEPMRPSPAVVVLAWLSQRPDGGHFYVTTITMAEILLGIGLLPKGKRHDKMLAQAEATFREDFAERILSFDEAAARAFPEIATARRAQGRPISEFDAQIAAIAHSRDATLATRNTADFEGCGVPLVNPWAE
ncbi:MAG: type II toxin-antitoxin system VapC family toxin [Candidatus Sulfotelmatobacter sp.]